MQLGKAGFKALQQEFERVNALLFSQRKENPKNEQVQETIARHYELIRKFWGTSDKKDKQAEAYAGLGQLYVHDERFTMVDGKPQPEYAQFLKEAMSHFAETRLK